MSEHFWLECAALVVGGAASIFVLRNRKTQEVGIGPRTMQGLVVCLLGPVILALAVEKILSAETVAALIGALVGYGIPKASSSD
jgi:hypothetical protein